MILRRVRAAQCGLAAVFLCGWTNTALADVEICNESEYLNFSTAIGYFDAAAKDWSSRGWVNTRPGQCKTAKTGPLAGDTVLVFSRYGMPYQETGDEVADLIGYGMASETQGEITGDFGLCITAKRFLIAGTRCVNRGFTRQGFREIKTGGAKHVLLELLDEGGVAVRPK